MGSRKPKRSSKDQKKGKKSTPSIPERFLIFVTRAWTKICGRVKRNWKIASILSSIAALLAIYKFCVVDPGQVRETRESVIAGIKVAIDLRNQGLNQDAAQECEDLLQRKGVENSPDLAAITRRILADCYLEIGNSKSDEALLKKSESFLNGVRDYLLLHPNPDEYFRTCLSLGRVYASRGEIRDRIGLLRVADSILASCQCTQVMTDPQIYCASLQSNRGVLFANLAVALDSVIYFEKSAEAFSEAWDLAVATDSRLTQAAIANSFANLANRVLDYSRSEPFVYWAQLFIADAEMIISAEEVPLSWAGLMRTRGNLYRRIGEMRRSTEYADSAVSMYRSAQQIFTINKYPVEFAHSANGIGNALALMARLTNSPDRYHDAIEEFQIALAVRQLADYPTDFAMTHMNIANAFLEWGSRSKECSLVDSAAVHIGKTLLIYVPEKYPRENKVALGVETAIDTLRRHLNCGL